MAFDKFSRTSMVGFARLIRRIRSRTSFRTDGRPGWPCRTFHVQKRRKPFRCQAITVSGLTTMSAERQSAHTPHSQAQRSQSNGVNFGFFTERCRMPSWCRSARFSNWRAARVLKTDDRAATSALACRALGHGGDGECTSLFFSDRLRFTGGTISQDYKLAQE